MTRGDSCVFFLLLLLLEGAREKANDVMADESSRTSGAVFEWGTVAIDAVPLSNLSEWFDGCHVDCVVVCGH